jgi:purine-binding chemotaxis protein CheW
MRKAIDWNQVKARLKTAQTVVETATVDPKHVAAVYGQRATKLAARQPEQAQATVLQGLCFLLNTERYVIELPEISEVLALSSVTPAPGTPPEVTGLTNLRGDIITVIDLGRLLELFSESNDAGYILILNRLGKRGGLRVKQVEKIIPLAHTDLQNASEAMSGHSSRYIKNFTQDNAWVLSIDALMSHPVFALGLQTREGFSNEFLD